MIVWAYQNFSTLVWNIYLLINYVGDKSIILEPWTISIINPNYKNNGGITQPENNRLITLLSCSCKKFTNTQNKILTDSYEHLHNNQVLEKVYQLLITFSFYNISFKGRWKSYFAHVYIQNKSLTPYKTGYDKNNYWMLEYMVEFYKLHKICTAKSKFNQVPKLITVLLLVVVKVHVYLFCLYIWMIKMTSFK